LGTPTQELDEIKFQTQVSYNLGLQAWHQEDFPRALNYFQQVVTQNPADTVALLYVERCQARLGLKSPQPEASCDGFRAL
jgi:cytochrome c-type biogenesis protein CcmH/NrfG